MPSMTERDEATGATATSYHHTRVVEFAGRTLRARVERDYYINQSFAVAEVLSDQMTWTSLAADAPSNRRPRCHRARPADRASSQ
jgi:hypothetical protein